MMLLKDPIYYYRKRAGNDSAIQTKLFSPEYYFITPDKVYKYLLNLSKKKYGNCIEYVQNLVMYDLQWRIKEEIKGLPKDDKQNYVLLIKSILEDIDDNIIFNQKNIYFEHKIFLLSLKYNYNILEKVIIKDNEIYFNDLELLNLDKNSLLRINVIDIQKDGKVNITGTINAILYHLGFSFFYIVNGKKKKLDTIGSNKNIKCEFVDFEIKNQIFDITLDDDIESIEFVIEKGDLKKSLRFNFSIHGRLYHKFKTYYSKYGKMVFFKGSRIYIKRNSILRKLNYNLIFSMKLLVNKRFNQFCYRILSMFLKLFKRKEIWLISDRTAVANDNGMHLFKYVCKQNNKKIDPYFVISKESKDYVKMKEYGKVLNHGTLKYKLYFLIADKIISSQADAWVINAFGKNERFYRDLYRFDFVFLQHGITQNDLSGWLNKIDKNIKLFITSTEKEAESIISGKGYLYDKNVVKTTGMARYDNLKDDNKKIIAIMPTWRKYLGGKVDGKTGIRMYNPSFKKSDYFKFYNNLINDKRLLKVMERFGYKGIFVVHPSHEENHSDFKGNDVFEVVAGFADYQTIFKNASLLISDYSSVLFDFAYLRKPIIYSQFDKKEFFSNHMFPEGYFKTDIHGFGPVITDYNKLVEDIIRKIEEGCVLESKYRKRIDDFYKYNDNKNCERIYNEIFKIK